MSIEQPHLKGRQINDLATKLFNKLTQVLTCSNNYKSTH